MTKKYLGINIWVWLVILFNLILPIYLIASATIHYLETGYFDIFSANNLASITLYSAVLTIPMIAVCVYIYKYRHTTLQKLKVIKLVLISFLLIYNLWSVEGLIAILKFVWDIE